MRALLAVALCLGGPGMLADARAQAAGERVALVVGNAAYPGNPLDNPRNDATAMADLLGRAGFAVDRQFDASLQQLKAAVERFGASIRDPRVKFAMFYYAGHGVQLDWRNYLIPVDAKVQSSEDVKRQTVDVSDLLRQMESARGKSFLVVLDACRDDPFAGSYRPRATGLSQFDAPSGSLLAYATAPGKVALDGAGANGLYTSNLLREFAVPGARLEDAFKRVRLNVRLASKGRQIPWESTSLEDDVYLFPAGKPRQTDAEKDRVLEQEINRWLQIRTSNDVGALAEFLREYPSGSASELAQSRLNRVLAAQSPRDGAGTAARTAAAPSPLDAELQDLQRRHAAAREAAERAEAQRVAVAREIGQQLLKAIEEARQMEAQRQEAQGLAAARQEAERQADRRRREEGLAVAERRRREADLALAERQREEAAALAAAQARAREEELRRQAAEQARLAQQRDEAAAEAARLEARQAQLRQEQAAAPAQLAAAGTAAPQVFAATPYSQGYAEHDRRYAVDDEFRFRVIDGFTRSERALTLQVTKVDGANDRVEYNRGEYASDFMGNIVRNLRGGMDTPRQFYPAELFVGKKWRTEFKQSRPSGQVYTFYYDLKVVAKESVTVPAGTFEAFKIEARGFNRTLNARLERNIWVTPGISADIAHETLVRLANGQIEQNDRQELVSLRRGS